jgi:hypothetical protein
MHALFDLQYYRHKYMGKLAKQKKISKQLSRPPSKLLFFPNEGLALQNVQALLFEVWNDYVTVQRSIVLWRHEDRSRVSMLGEEV